MTAAARPLLLALGLFCGTLACVLLDPVPELEKPIRRAPSIAETSMYPANDRPLLELPLEFRVQIRVADPGQGFVWAFFVDDEAITAQAVAGSPTAKDLIDIAVDRTQFFERATTTGCHRFKFLVALEWADNTAIVARPELSDSVSWWYVPDGTGACGLYDAGGLLEAGQMPRPDAGPVDPDGGLAPQ